MTRVVRREGTVRVAVSCLIAGTLLLGMAGGAVASGEATEAWVARYDGPVSDYDGGYAVTVDDSGNVYVTGLGNSTSFDYVTVKYGPAGNQLWAARYDGDAGGMDRAYDIAVDSLGNVYVTGFSEGVGTAYDYATV